RLPQQLARGNTLPQVAQPRPLRHAVEVAEHFDPGKFGKFFPTPGNFFSHQSADPKAPSLQIECRRTACVQDRPLPSPRLAGWHSVRPLRIRADHHIGSKILPCRNLHTLRFALIHFERRHLLHHFNCFLREWSDRSSTMPETSRKISAVRWKKNCCIMWNKRGRCVRSPEGKGNS